jgi:HEAT repeat protein/glycosyltransferase involved in cell wall biosynthesis
VKEATVAQPGILPEKPRLSICMIVRNEEKMLPRCLRSVQSIADELIVVDTGSTDNSVSTAKDLGAKIFQFKWCDDFAVARNESLRHATADWILQIDADEELSKSSIEPLRRAMQNPWCLLYVITCNDNYVENESQRFIPVPRLFRNHPSISYNRPYHEMVDLSVQRIMRTEPGWHEEVVADIVIHHYGYECSNLRQKGKDAMALRIMESYMKDNPDDSYILLMLGELYFRLGWYDKAINNIEKAKSLIVHSRFDLYAGFCYDVPSELPPWFCYILALAYYRKGLYHEAIAECKRVLAVDPLDTHASDCLAQAIDALGPQAASKYEYANVQQAETNAFGKTGETAVETIIDSLHDVDWNVRREAAEALGKVGDVRAIEALTEVLNDQYGDRVGAAWALGEIKDARAAKPLIEALRDQHWYFTWGIRWAAAKALAKIGEPAGQHLTDALNHDDKGIRWGAAWALGEIKDARAAKPLIEALRDEDDCVRREAARALGEIGDVKGVEPLILALNDTYCGARREAAQSLGKIGGQRVVEPLIEALRDEDWDVRRQAALALGGIRDSRSLEALIETLEDVNGDVRKAASEALSRIDPHRSLATDEDESTKR